MVRRILAGIGVSVVAAHVGLRAGRQAPPTGRAAAAAAAPKLPTEAQWAAMSPKAKEYVDKARAIAGNDPDLLFDFGIFCKASGGSQNEDRATVGVPNSEPQLRPYPAPESGQGGRRAAPVRQLLLDRQHRHRRVADHVERRLHPVRHDEQRGRRARHHHPRDQEAESRSHEDQVPGLRPQPLRSHRRRRIHPADDRREGGDASRRLGALPEEHRPRRRRPRRSRRRAPARRAAAPRRRRAAAPTAEDEARHRRHRRHEAHGRRRDRHDLHDDGTHAGIDRHGRAGEVAGHAITRSCS